MTPYSASPYLALSLGQSASRVLEDATTVFSNQEASPGKCCRCESTLSAASWRILECGGNLAAGMYIFHGCGRTWRLHMAGVYPSGGSAEWVSESVHLQLA
jgi:hypothetical protein